MYVYTLVLTMAYIIILLYGIHAQLPERSAITLIAVCGFTSAMQGICGASLSDVVVIQRQCCTKVQANPEVTFVFTLPPEVN